MTHPAPIYYDCKQIENAKTWSSNPRHADHDEQKLQGIDTEAQLCARSAKGLEAHMSIRIKHEMWRGQKAVCKRSRKATMQID